MRRPTLEIPSVKIDFKHDAAVQVSVWKIKELSNEHLQVVIDIHTSTQNGLRFFMVARYDIAHQQKSLVEFILKASNYTDLVFVAANDDGVGLVATDNDEAFFYRMPFEQSVIEVSDFFRLETATEVRTDLRADV